MLRTLSLPNSDIVYGEYTNPAAVGAETDTVYPVGTVLTYPCSVIPKKSVDNQDSGDTPWFIVFKPCPKILLGGAVPVGRIMSFVPGRKPAHHYD